MTSMSALGAKGRNVRWPRPTAFILEEKTVQTDRQIPNRCFMLNAIEAACNNDDNVNNVGPNN